MPASHPRPQPAAPEFFSPQVREARRFYLDLAPAAETPLAVVCGGREQCAADYAIHRATFPYYSIEFVAAGRGTLRLAGAEYRLLPGAVFAYGPDVPQDITTDRRDPLLKYFVDFAGRRGRELIDDCGPPLGGIVRLPAPGPLQQLFDELIDDGLQAGPLAPRLCAALLEYLFLKIADSHLPWEPAETPAFVTWQRCRQHVEREFLRLKSVGQIARECHVAQAYLCRLFQRYARQSPYQFLLRLKMNYAAGRLHEPGVLVKQVAAELGFDDPFHFSRAFKRVLGVSPEAFRRLR